MHFPAEPTGSKLALAGRAQRGALAVHPPLARNAIRGKTEPSLPESRVKLLQSLAEVARVESTLHTRAYKILRFAARANLEVLTLGSALRHECQASRRWERENPGQS